MMMFTEPTDATAIQRCGAPEIMEPPAARHQEGSRTCVSDSNWMGT
jgi:hypothetical protein